MQEPQTALAATVVETVEPGLHTIVASIDAAMRSGRISPGDQAQLRRLDVRHPDQPAFWRALAAFGGRQAHASEDMETRWAILLNGMARMGSGHQPGVRLGAVLARAGFSEARFTRLLRTHGVASAEVIRRMCAFLISKGESIDWCQLASLVLTTDPDRAESLRRSLASEYYSTEHDEDKEKKTK